jgi:tetratricopeptide (TPR) repeat protein
MAKKDGSKKAKPESTPQSVGVHVGGNVDKGNIVVGNNNVINNYFQVVEKNTEQNDPDYWNLKHPYPMPPNFTGRIAERALLTQWLHDDSENRLFILRALGGFGKSALAWQWLTHDVDPQTWTKVIFWSFYEGDASFENFIEDTLKYLKQDVPQSKREQVDELLKAMQSQKVLFIIDGFERLLRAYGNMNASHQSDEDKKREDTDRDCVNLSTEHFLKSICSMPNMKSRALMTTRMTPRALEKFGEFIQGCHEEELKAMHKDDAIAFFRAQGIHKGTNHEVEEVCRSYGFHPLSLRLLAGHIMSDFKNAGDIVVAQKLNVSGDIATHQNHILAVSYNGLSTHQQKLLSTIACFRSSTKLDVLESVTENKETLETDLHDLMKRGLLQYDRNNKVFDLHPIVRRFAYDRLTTVDRTSAHERLINYFEAVSKPEKVEKLEDLAPVIELYHHMVRAGNLDDAIKLFRDRIVQQVFFQFGAYQLCIELMHALFLDGEDKPPRLKDEAWQAWTLNTLASAYSMSGQPRNAVPLYLINVDYDEKHGRKKHLAIGLGNLAQSAQLPIGALSAAERNLRKMISLAKEIEDEFRQARGHHEIGKLLSYLGAWDNADEELSLALETYEEINNPEWQGKTWAYRALRFLLMARGVIVSNQSSIECAQRALELADETAKTQHQYPRDYVRVYWLLGSAYLANNELTLAEENLSKALNLCRQINAVETEAEILLDLARLRYAQGDFKDAQEKVSEALMITERSGYVLIGADLNLFLAQYALEQEKDKAKAKVYAEEAMKLATCDGPPYYYKVAYEEAERMLEMMNEK